MYNISSEYKTACKALTRQSRTKIVIDNITYDGSQYIKDYPKFSHSNETMIGGFPIKSAEFSLWIKNGTIEIINKEIKIYRGLVINEVIEWVPQGVFFAEAEDITTSDTGEYITVKCYDSAKKLGNKIYKDNNTYPLSESSYIKNVISQAGYEVDENVFVESNYMMQQKPNMPETTNSREIISRYAEQRGAIALFSRLGKVQIKKPTEIDFTYLFYQYKKLSCEKAYGPLNQLIIGNTGIENNVIFPSGKQSYPWNMDDNPFLDLLKEVRREEVYSQIEAQKLTPFSLESALDSFYLDINDIISVQKKDGSYISLTILSIETENRLKCKIGASVQNKKDISYGLAGSIKEDIDAVKFEVDYNKKQILAAVSNSNEALSQTSQLEIEIGKIQGIVSEKADTTVSAEKVGTVTLENINQSEVIMLRIHPTSEDILSSYLSNNKFLSDQNYFVTRKVVFKNENGYKAEYRLPADLRILNGVYDEFTLNLNNRICTVVKKIGINANGEKYLLTQPLTQTFEYPTINLEEGNYSIYMPSYKTANIFCRLMAKNAYTDQFAVKVEVKSMIEQLKDQITLQVNKKLEGYSTTTEMNSAIIMKASEINNSVNLKISDVNGNIKNINASLSLKVDEKNLISIINAKADVIKLEGNRFSWTSSNSSLSEDGTLKAKNVDISGKITATSGTFSGKITATSGKIGGFDIGTNNITSTTDNCRVTILNATNVNKDFLVVRTGTSEANYEYPFWVRGDGTLHAEKADIAGKITATSGSFTGKVTANSGKIADWSITEGKIYAGDSTTGVAVVQRPAGNMNWVFAAGGSSHESYGDCPFRVSKAGKLYASGVEITGKVTATSGSINGSLVTSGINANNLTSGSVTSCNIDIYNGTGFLRMLNGSAYHPFVSALNVARGSGGVVFRSSGDRTNTGNNIGQIYADNNVIYISASNGTNIANYLKCGNIGISDNKVRGNSDSEITLNYSVVLKPNPNGGAYIWGTEDYNKILTASGSPSSLCVKEKVTEKDTSDIPNILKKIKLYDYKYIEEIENGKKDYGYIIDYLEEIPNIKKYFDFYDVERNNLKFKQIAHEHLSKFLLGAVVELQKEIEELERRLLNEKRS